MPAPSVPTIRFAQGAFAALRARLRADAPREAFAVLLARRETVGEQVMLKVIETRYPQAADYLAQEGAHLRLRRDYVHQVLCEVNERWDVDTLIDVHTHPFCPVGAAFSGVDDADEQRFLRFLDETFEGLHYASIVLSASDYAARLWQMDQGRTVAEPARIRTQTAGEGWPGAELPAAAADAELLRAATDGQSSFLARSVLALGLENLRRIVQGQTIALVGVGGLGSLVAENLVHSGFHDLHLIDPDVLEVSNLNRIAGAYYEDARQQRLKVEVVQRHLQAINPNARITAHPRNVGDEDLQPVLASADWIVVSTDNHTSRFQAQQAAARYYVPLLSVGANITVTEGRITDMSGEIITARIGDRLCLHCLGRLNPIRIAAEQHPDAHVREQLVTRGYVTGQEVKEPAVKTLNAMLAALAVDTLINQYTDRQPHVPVLVFENNRQPTLYADWDSVARRPKNCFTCGVGEGE